VNDNVGFDRADKMAGIADIRDIAVPPMQIACLAAPVRA
jgi:hypothetical protein